MISLSSKIGCFEFCWVTGILMIMMASTVYDAYVVTNLYEGLKFDGKILDYHKCGLKRGYLILESMLTRLKSRRNHIGFTFRDLPSLEVRFDSLKRESDMSTRLK
ncbi:hypothetical protein LIER_38428 [Lithospermum erythrorhizon]|uniref:Uncharacterized protein n=1 Tax=Lithospermum erythrorhizon TaxID=34254 RepID=A0AAV3PZT6_LITER